MFEYAVGRSLAAKRKADLKVVFNHPPAYSARKYQLDCFRLMPDLKVEIIGGGTDLLSKIKKTIFSSKENVIKERSFTYDPEVLKSPDGVMLDGYFQSEKYFRDIENLIRNDFTFKKNLTGRNKEVADRIRNSSSISLHIRRGDYVADKSTNAFHGAASLDYYVQGVKYLKNKVTSPRYFVFSDDISWAKDNLKLPDATFIDWNVGGNDYIDMQLMSMCQHNIVANSSFSWWGAWLNANPRKIVIAPKRWFADKSMNTKDLLPSSWIKL